jgi:hypothetical protein
MDSDRVQAGDTAAVVTIGGIVFDNNFYDRDVDVLYLHVGDPAAAVGFDATAEGDHTRFGADGDLIGLTILSPKYRLAHDGRIELTLPDRTLVATDFDDLLS